MFVTKSPGSRILMLVINNHYRAPQPPARSSGDPQMISSYVKIFVRTSARERGTSEREKVPAFA